jgi:serine/threonine-protein kinase
LNHPNILTIHEIGEMDGRRFIASEYVNGTTLRDRLTDEPLDVGGALNISIQIADALAAAHAAGIVHPDIKPENVIVREDGIAKVVDFGLAKLKGSSDPEADTRPQVKTKSGTILGTAFYMSPEQARGKVVDERTDIFSLGVVMYRMLSGRLPFRGETMADTLAAILKNEPRSLGSLNADLPAEFERIIDKTLEKDRDERYQSAKELLVDLKHLRKQIELTSELKRTSTTSEFQDTKPIRAYQDHDRSTPKRTFVIAVLSIVFVGSLGIGYWLYTTPSGKQIDSIAVMPFENASANTDVDYLSDGMTEMLINSLSELPNLNVKARSSVFRYKGKDIELPRIGQELNVQAILTGRIVQRGDNLTLSWDLVDAKTERHLAGGQYNRKLADVVALQSEIARDVARKLRDRLSGADEQKITKTHTSNPEAYQLYLKGRFHILKNTPPDTLRAIPYFEKAIETDPRYALAYVGLADAYRGLALGSEMRPTEYFPKGKAAAQRALEIDGNLAEAHAILGWITFWYDWDWAAAENDCKRALDLDPDSGDAHMIYAHILSTTGRHQEALAEANRASELDPLNLRNLVIEVSFNIYAGQVETASSKLDKVFELDPNYWWAHQWAARAYLNKGQFGEAEASARRAIELNEENSRSAAYLGYTLARSGKQREARVELEKLLKRSSERYTAPVSIAMIYIGLGERSEALKWLEHGVEQREPRLVFLKVDPIFNDLRDEVRFKELLNKVQFPE